jgi:hypothetical protein
VLVRRGDRDYKIRGLDKNMSSLTLRVNIQAARRDMLHLDSIDLMRSAARAAFIKATAKKRPSRRISGWSCSI